MVRKLVSSALDNPLVVIMLSVFLVVMGVISFLNVNVEAYPDPAPAIVEVIAQFPGASALEVERQVTIPLEVTFSGMPGLKKNQQQVAVRLQRSQDDLVLRRQIYLRGGTAKNHQPPRPRLPSLFPTA